MHAAASACRYYDSRGGHYSSYTQNNIIKTVKNIRKEQLMWENLISNEIKQFTNKKLKPVILIKNSDISLFEESKIENPIKYNILDEYLLINIPYFTDKNEDQTYWFFYALSLCIPFGGVHKILYLEKFNKIEIKKISNVIKRINNLKILITNDKIITLGKLLKFDFLILFDTVGDISNISQKINELKKYFNKINYCIKSHLELKTILDEGKMIKYNYPSNYTFNKITKTITDYNSEIDYITTKDNSTCVIM